MADAAITACKWACSKLSIAKIGAGPRSSVIACRETRGGVCMCVCVFLIKADCALASLTHLKQAPRLAFQKTHELWSGR